MEAEAAGGVSTPATQDSAWVTSKDSPWRRAHGDGGVRDGDLVAFGAGVLAGGYVGEVGRTWPVGEFDEDAGGALYRRRDELWARMIDACRPGAPASVLLDAYQAAGEPLPPMPVAHGLGLGFDPPVITPRLPETAAGETLEDGMVLALTGYVWEQGVGRCSPATPSIVTADGAEVLSASPSWQDVRV